MNHSEIKPSLDMNEYRNSYYTQGKVSLFSLSTIKGSTLPLRTPVDSSIGRATDYEQVLPSRRCLPLLVCFFPYVSLSTKSKATSFVLHAES